MSNRREYIRNYMREYRARKRGGEPTTRLHLACDRQIAELRAQVEAQRERIRDLEAAVGFLDEEPA